MSEERRLELDFPAQRGGGTEGAPSVPGRGPPCQAREAQAQIPGCGWAGWCTGWRQICPSSNRGGDTGHHGPLKPAEVF